jgi:hypothetical protein
VPFDIQVGGLGREAGSYFHTNNLNMKWFITCAFSYPNKWVGEGIEIGNLFLHI